MIERIGRTRLTILVLSLITALMPMLALALAAGALPARAEGDGEFDAGMRAANMRNFSEAIRLWRPLAEAGDARAQYHLAMLVESGEGTTRDPSAAAILYGLAAKQGHGGAQNALAILLIEGRGVPRDPPAAYAWFALAARGGNGFAQANLRRLRAMISPEIQAEGERRLRDLLAMTAGPPR